MTMVALQIRGEMMDYLINGSETSYQSNARRKRITYSIPCHTQKSVPGELKTYVKGTSLKFKKKEREKTIVMLEQRRTVFKNKKCNIKNTNQKGKRLTNLTKKMDLQAIGKIHYGTWRG